MAAVSTDSSLIPDKLYYRIGEVSRIAGVPSSVLRFWEKEFPRIKPQRTEAGQRVYRRKEVVLILTIKQLLYDQKFTIKGARRYLKERTGTQPAINKKDLVRLIRNELQSIRDMLE